MLSIRVNGDKYEYFKEASITRSIDTLTSTFSFTATQSPGEVYPIRVSDQVEILADSVLVLTGYVETLDVSGDHRSHGISVAGRGLLCDLIDSSIGKTKEFLKVITLPALIRTVLDDINMNFVRVYDRLCNIEPFKETDISSAEVGDSAFEFLEKYSKKRQVLLNETPRGNIEIIRGETSQRGLYNLSNRIGSSKNNILRYALKIDQSNRYHTYNIKTQLDPTLQSITMGTDLVVDQGGTSKDNTIRGTRTLDISDNESMDSSDAGELAIWENNIRRARSLQYTAVVQGHTLNGTPWKPNTLVHIEDDFCGVSSDLLVRSVDMSYSSGSGSITTLSFADKDTYKLIAEKRETGNQDNVLAGVFLKGEA